MLLPIHENREKTQTERSYLLMELLHVLPFLPTRRRRKGFKKTLQGRGYIKAVEVAALETLNVFDLVVLLGVTRAFLDSELIDGGGYLDEKGKEARKMYILAITKYRLLKDYLGMTPSTPNKRLVEASLTRLTSCTWRLWFVDTQNSYRAESIEVKILMRWDSTESGYRIWANKRYIDKVKAGDGVLSVVLNYVRNCKTDVGKMLVVWLQGQKNLVFKEKTLFKALHLDEVFKNRRDARAKLKKALEDARQAGYLETWKRDGDAYALHRHTCLNGNGNSNSLRLPKT